MPVNRLDYTENRDGGNHGKFDVFLSKKHNKNLIIR